MVLDLVLKHRTFDISQHRTCFCLPSPIIRAFPMRSHADTEGKLPSIKYRDRVDFFFRLVSLIGTYVVSTSSSSSTSKYPISDILKIMATRKCENNTTTAVTMLPHGRNYCCMAKRKPLFRPPQRAAKRTITSVPSAVYQRSVGRAPTNTVMIEDHVLPTPSRLTPTRMNKIPII